MKKKLIGYGAILGAVATGASLVSNDASATSASYESYLGAGAISFDESVDVTSGIHHVTQTIKVTEAFAQSVLSQKPGNAKEPVSLSSFRIGVTMDVIGGDNTVCFEKSGNWIDKNASVAEKIEKAKVQLTENDCDSSKTAWTHSFWVEYNNAGTWNITNTKGTGNRSIGQDISGATGVAVDDLVYGVDYRFSVRNTETNVMVWRNKGAKANVATRDKNNDVDEFVFVDAQIVFPVNSQNANGFYSSYTTVEGALTNGDAKSVTINESMSINSDVTLPADVELIVPAGTALTIPSGVTLNVEGDILNRGTITNEGTITLTDEGASIVNTNLFANNGTIEVLEGKVTNSAALANNGTIQLADSEQFAGEDIAGNGDLVNAENKAYHKILQDTAVNSPIIPFDKDMAVEGDTVTVVNLPDAGEGYSIEYKIFDAANAEISVSNNSFTMPNSDVTIKSKYVANTNNIEVNGEGLEHVAITSTAPTDGTVWIEVEEGYVIDEITVTQKNDTTKTVTVSSIDSDPNFRMPADDVVITIKVVEKAYEVTLMSAEHVKALTTTKYVKDSTVSFEAEAGYEIVNISVSYPGSSFSFRGSSFEMPESDVDVVIVTQKKSLNISTDENVESVTIEDIEVSNALIGDIVKVTPKTVAGKKATVSVVTASGEEITVSNDNTFEMPGEAVSIAVNYTDETYTVSVDGQNVTADKFYVKMGETVKIYAAEGYKLTSLTVDGVEVELDEDGTYSFVMSDANVVVNGIAKEEISEPTDSEPTKYKVTLIGEGYEALEEDTLEVDTEIILTAKPGYRILGVTIPANPLDNTSVEQSVEGDTFRVPAHNAMITVRTEKLPYTVSIDASDTTTTVDKLENVVLNEVVTVTAEIKTGQTLKGVTVTGVTSGTEVNVKDVNGGKYVFNMPAENVIVKANYEYETYSVTVFGGSDKIEALAESYHYGDTVKFVPKEGYKVVKISFLLGGYEDVIGDSFTMPAESVYVSVTVEEISSDEPSTDEPSADEPTTDEPSTDEPSTDEPVEDEPSEDEPSEDEPSETPGDEPGVDEPSEEEPGTDEPGENPGEETPGEENPSETPNDTPSETPGSEDEPGESETPGESEKPSENDTPNESETPSEEQPGEDEPSEDTPNEEQPSEEQPSEETPSEEQPSEEQPSEDEPVVDENGNKYFLSHEDGTKDYSTPTFNEGDEYLLFHINGEYTQLQAVYINDYLVDPAFYTISEGSTIIKIGKAFIEKFIRTENNVLRAVYPDGEAVVPFKVASEVIAANAGNGSDSDEDSEDAPVVIDPTITTPAADANTGANATVKPNKGVNPNTNDDFAKYLIIGGASLLTMAGTVVFAKKTVKE